MKTRIFRSLLAGAVAASCAVAAHSAEYTLRFAHFFPAVSTPHKAVFQAWADAVEKESNGRIEVVLYPSSTLAKPPALYDAAKNGIADVIVTVQGYTANRFPMTQIVELPGLAKSAEHGSCIVQSLYDKGDVKKEYRDTKPLFFFTHGPGHIHTTETPIREPKDLEGLRIRRPSAVVAKLLEGLGAQPVGMPAPESYQAVQRGVIDGVSLPWEGQLSFRLNELTNHHTEVGGLYTLAFVATMNKATYAKLPADLRKVIDNNSGMKWAQKAGVVFDQLDVKGRAQAVEAGHDIYQVEGGIENPVWKPVIEQARDAYLADLKARKLPADKIYKKAQVLAEDCQ
ncbi:MAG: TRAP transporter substrate-binding protein [Oceanobacter sp.]